MGMEKKKISQEMSWVNLKSLKITCRVFNLNIDPSTSLLSQLIGCSIIAAAKSIDIPNRYLQYYKDSYKQDEVRNCTNFSLRNYVLLWKQTNPQENGVYCLTEEYKLTPQKWDHSLTNFCVFSTENDAMYCDEKNHWHAIANCYLKWTHDYALDAHKEIMLLKQEIQEIKTMIHEIYYAPNMPGYIKGAKSFTKETSTLNQLLVEEKKKKKKRSLDSDEEESELKRQKNVEHSLSIFSNLEDNYVPSSSIK